MPRQNELVITLTELIIPQTDTPGAKAAKVNEYIDMVLADANPAIATSSCRASPGSTRGARSASARRS